jgi:hypothetical protein
MLRLAVLREKDEAAEERRLMAMERAQLEARRDELNALGERISARGIAPGGGARAGDQELGRPRAGGQAGQEGARHGGGWGR